MELSQGISSSSWCYQKQDSVDVISLRFLIATGSLVVVANISRNQCSTYNVVR